MQCTGDTTYSMSQLCLEAWSNSENQSEFWIDQNCFPQNIDSVRVIAGIWCTLNALIGLPGNLLTLLAIPYCVRRKKYEISRFLLNIFLLVKLKLYFPFFYTYLYFLDLIYIIIGQILYSY